MSDSVQPHSRQPTRLPRSWDSPGKNTGVGCHFLLQCIKVTSESEVTQSCPTLCDPMDRSLPGSSIHEIFQARVLLYSKVNQPNVFRCPLFFGFPFHLRSPQSTGFPVLYAKSLNEQKATDQMCGQHIQIENLSHVL